MLFVYGVFFPCHESKGVEVIQMDTLGIIVNNFINYNLDQTKSFSCLNN